MARNTKHEAETKDAKIVGKVFTELLVLGAASTERLTQRTKLDRASVQWACCQLGAHISEGAQLWSLPDNMLPLNWK